MQNDVTIHQINLRFSFYTEVPPKEWLPILSLQPDELFRLHYCFTCTGNNNTNDTITLIAGAADCKGSLVYNYHLNGKNITGWT